MDGDRLAEIRARVEVATPGPWDFDPNNPGLVGPDGELVAAYASQDNFNNDCLFVAHAREDIPWLLAEVERLRAENAQDQGQREIVVDERNRLDALNNTLRAQLTTARADALEEAAKTVRAMAHTSCVHESCNGLRAAAEAIRGLKDKP